MYQTPVTLILLSILIETSFCRPGLQPALLYLSRYGYLTPRSTTGSADVLNAETFRRSLKEFQAFVGIQVTGKLDRKTIEMMSVPRCGVKDKIGKAKGKNKRASQGSKWHTMNLKYKVSTYPRKLPKSDVDKTIRKAFDLWQENANLTFEQCGASTKTIHLDLKFLRGMHGDDSPFEGPGGVLAHAFFPDHGGSIHFDDEEPWSANTPQGVNLLQIANHEIGHALGLSHSDEIDASMSPLYNDYIPNFMLHMDDILSIQQLYGKRRERRPDSDAEDEEWRSYWENWERELLV